MTDRGLTHVALEVTDADASAAFYARFGGFEVVHRRVDPDDGVTVLWLSDLTRPFVIVLLETKGRPHPLGGSNHLGVGVGSRAEVDRLSGLAQQDGCLVLGPLDSGPPVGYWAIFADPDGHNLEVSFGQEVGQAVAHRRAAG